MGAGFLAGVPHFGHDRIGALRLFGVELSVLPDQLLHDPLNPEVRLPHEDLGFLMPLVDTRLEPIESLFETSEPFLGAIEGLHHPFKRLLMALKRLLVSFEGLFMALEGLLMALEGFFETVEGAFEPLEGESVELHQVVAALQAPIQPRRQSPSPHRRDSARPKRADGALNAPTS